MAKRKRGQTPKSKPVFSVGPFKTGSALVEVSVWENAVGEADDERTVFGIGLKRSFKDGDQWRESKVFRAQDLPHLMIAIQEAYLFCQNESAKK